ncbi:UDP-N-acetylmuramoyl-L-alanyl-D-glutamate--2,6-diaminopimelate ligase [Psychrobacter sp. M13]|uniref:UDP-N-acetylmuramoyl-L-alanyl-D-glutamate--2, 6-diaminopimelate ligase n=1 Tax=Psychrobacter sp. M13 TaxID=3067275 RepID=UPI00273B7B08|nr:UDP-N-acetylmuramoyl-L-alanyl-D-glutamate--2,6-diaminopimelate ligase [Psychrobacter sp. M13]WLP94410.1 UDP-N-acetylmuramoyl-L-alanyl-D-glutamate--2,6-diaminopimelate ligase [Psychrobacter sp. M13]
MTQASDNTVTFDTVTLQQLIDSSSDSTINQSLRGIARAADGLDSINEIPFHQLCLDSRQVNKGDVFVLLTSQTQNPQASSEYLKQAAAQAAFILSEIEPSALLATDDESANNTQDLDNLPCPVLYVPNIRDVLGDLAQAKLQYHQSVALPSVVAVTGTNGKTTISQLVAQLAQLASLSSAVMGTAGNGRLGALVQASHTTGDALAVQQFLHQMGVESADLLALEASSHGLDQQRLQGVPIKVAIYTNLSRDHLDYHTDMDEYVAAKAKLFDRRYFPDLTHAIINIDDAHGENYAQVMLDTAYASELTVWTYSLQPSAQATFVATDIEPSLEGVKITLRTQIADTQTTDITVVSPLLGRFNVANLLAAIGAVVALGIDIEQVAKLVPQLQGAVGRMQRVASNDGCFIVDYAHTPDALSQVLASLKTHCKGQLWAVFGCGGDRDSGKRPLMAQAGLAGADRVILTADNPRTEDPKQILQDMQVGMSTEQYQRTYIEHARRQAIEYAVNHAGVDDIVVIAGKGHETYQEIHGVRHDFDDSIVLQQALQQAGRL